jgi:hypothetical protein
MEDLYAVVQVHLEDLVVEEMDLILLLLLQEVQPLNLDNHNLAH